MAYFSVPIKTNIVMLIDRDDYALLRHIGELFPTKNNDNYFISIRGQNKPITLIVGQGNFFSRQSKMYMSGLYHHYYAALTC